MKIKEFEALTLKDCLQQVRQEMGPEAVILETRKFRKGGIMGLGSREAVRIIAATGIAITEPGKEERVPGSGVRPDSSSEPRTRNPADRSPNAQRPTPNTRRLDSESEVARLEREIQELRSGFDAVRQVMLGGAVSNAPSVRGSHPGLAGTPSLPEEAGQSKIQNPESSFPGLFARLREADVSKELANELLESLPDLSGWSEPARGPMAESILKDLMTRRVQSSGPIEVTPGQRKTVALIGPTGVGKTTTIAKLAAHFALVEKRKVGLLTMDTYRIAAVEQLKTYSQIIDIPVQVVYNPADVGAALTAFKDYDLVLIDTAGRSQKNVMQVSELKTLREAAECETHLVLSASTKERDLYDQVNRFTKVGVDRLIFTKLDETTAYGTIYTIAARYGLPVSYLTTGQKVPEDIEVAESARIVAMVLNSPARA